MMTGDTIQVSKIEMGGKMKSEKASSEKKY